MCPGNMPYQGEPQAIAGPWLGRDPKKWLEDARLELGSNARALVGDVEDHGVVVLHELNLATRYADGESVGRT